MSKSILTIQREILKKDYAKTPLGQLEKKIGKFYNELRLANADLPKELLKQVNEIRAANEKAQMDYLDRTNREHREFIDRTLLDSMSQEWALLEKYHGGKIKS